MSVKTVKSRLVLNFPGFEPTRALAQLDRLQHSAQKTGEVWKFDYIRESAEQQQGSNHAIALSTAKGANWSTRTRLVQFSWNDIISHYEHSAYPQSLVTNLPKYLAFLADGSVFRYLRASPRYFGFTIYPVLLTAIFAAVSWFAAAWVSGALLGGSVIASAALAFLLLLVLFRWPGDQFYLNLSVNDWAFARDMVNSVNPEIEARYEEFADTLASEILDSRDDEILIVGHSFGAVWAAAALAKALDQRADLLKGKNLTFLALGSSIPKIGLAPNARFMREHVTRIMQEENLFWHEIQTKIDVIAFYKADPFQAMGIKDIKAQYKIHRVNYKKAMDRKRHSRMMRSLYKTHRQYILYQDKRVHFDYILRCFGPFDAKSLALDKELCKTLNENGRLTGNSE